MSKPKILFIGEHPQGFSGNSHMISAILKQVDPNKFDVTVFAGSKGVVIDPSKETIPFQVIEGFHPEQIFGSENISIVLEGMDFDAVVFVGIDLWQCAFYMPRFVEIKNRKKFKWVSIFPYDIIDLREDWLELLKPIDFPCVYSEYGYDMLKGHVDNIQYYRPPLYDSENFVALPEEERKNKQREVFKALPKDAFVFGFFGVNMFRKDPQRLIKAFFDVKQSFPNAILYLHTEMKEGNYNIEQYLMDCKKEKGDVYAKPPSRFYDTKALCTTYNLVDCYVSPTLQEGLSWTVLEAMLCGTPVIASDTTAQKELIKGGAGLPVLCNQLAYIPIWTGGGSSWIEARACDLEDLKHKMKLVMTDPLLRKSLREKGLARAKEWLSGVDNINDLLTEVTKAKYVIKAKKKEVLFVQHSSAGDVLISTQCFKGIKERHKGKPLVYMTQKIFQDIVQENPYIDKIIDYDESVWGDYETVYNPHGEKILPGGWNNLDVTLYAMYPYFCKVKADKMFIKEKKPDLWEHIEKYIVFHSTGGSIEYRTYTHMNHVVKGVKALGYKTVQIGGKLDLACEDIDIDLRSKLTWRETAWVMKRAEAAVVIDSFPAHLAGALDVPAVVLFGPAPARVTQPRSDVAKIVCLQPNMLEACKILSHCWSTPPEGKELCNSPCINTINPLVILKHLKELLEGE